MTKLEPTFDFIATYLSPFSNQKGIEKAQQELAGEPDDQRDQFLSEVKLASNLVEVLEKSRRSSQFTAFTSKIADAKLQYFYKLHPNDLILVSPLFNIELSDLALSIALDSPAESIAFRRTTLKKQLAEEGVNPQTILKAIKDRQMSPPERKTRINFLYGVYRLPAWARLGIETFIVLFSLIGLFWVVPEVRNRYETLIQKRINDYLIETSLTDSPAPAGLSKRPSIEAIQNIQKEAREPEIAKSSSEEVTSKKPPKVNDGEMWRFSFTGSASNEIEAAAVAIIRRYINTGENPKNMVVPGGIQYDFYIETKQLLSIKSDLEKAVQQTQQRTSPVNDSALGRINMSWYKKKIIGAKKIPHSHVQVIIWISTL